MEKTVLVIGAAGYLGTSVCKKFLQENYKIKALIRENDKFNPELNDKIEIHKGSIASYDDVFSASYGSDFIINCAVMMPDRDNSIPWSVFSETNCEGGKIVLRVAEKQGIERVILISTAGVLEMNPKDGSANDDYTLRQGFNHYLKSKIDFERWLYESNDTHYPNWVLLRPSSIYGQGLSFKWPQVVEMIKTKKAKMIGDGRAIHPLIHVSDLTEAIYKAATCPLEKIRGQRITISSSERISVRDIMETLANYYGVAIPSRIPYLLAITAAYALSFLPRSWCSERMLLLNPGNIREYAVDRNYDTSKARNLLDFEFKISFQSGMMEMLDDIEFQIYEQKRDTNE